MPNPPRRWHPRKIGAARLCVILALIRSWQAASGEGDRGLPPIADAKPIAASQSAGDEQSALRTALCKPCPARGVTDPGEPGRAMEQEGADHPIIWVQSTLGTGRTGNIIKRLHRAITHAHACKALLFLPETDSWDSFSPPPASTVIDFRVRPGGRHPRCSSAEMRGLDRDVTRLEFGAGGAAETNPEASNWRLAATMAHWTWTDWRSSPPPGRADVKAGSARGNIIWFTEEDMVAAGIATDRAALHAWRKAADDQISTYLRHYLGFCEPGFCEGALDHDEMMGDDNLSSQARTAAAAHRRPRRRSHLRVAAMGGTAADQDPSPPASSYLAVHIRQGDLYPPNFERSHFKVNVQPPLAYYLSILGHRAWRRVDILAERGVPEGPTMAGLRLLRSYGALPGDLQAPMLDARGLARPSPIALKGLDKGSSSLDPLSSEISFPELVFPDEQPLGLAAVTVNITEAAQVAASNARSNKTTAAAAAAWRADIQKMVCSDAVVTALSSAATIAGLGFARVLYAEGCTMPFAAQSRVWSVRWDRKSDGTVVPTGDSVRHGRSGIWRPPYQSRHNNSAAEWAGALLTPAAKPVRCSR